MYGGAIEGDVHQDQFTRLYAIKQLQPASEMRYAAFDAASTVDGR